MQFSPLHKHQILGNLIVAEKSYAERSVLFLPGLWRIHSELGIRYGEQSKEKCKIYIHVYKMQIFICFGTSVARLNLVRGTCTL